MLLCFYLHTILHNGCNCSYLGFFFCAYINIVCIFCMQTPHWGKRVSCECEYLCLLLFKINVYSIYIYRITNWHKQIYYICCVEYILSGKNTANFIARAFHIHSAHVGILMLHNELNPKKSTADSFDLANRFLIYSRFCYVHLFEYTLSQWNPTQINTHRHSYQKAETQFELL